MVGAIGVLDIVIDNVVLDETLMCETAPGKGPRSLTGTAFDVTTIRRPGNVHVGGRMKCHFETSPAATTIEADAADSDPRPN